MATILVVDNRSENLDLLAYLLGRAGHKVVTALGGELGLAMARELIPDLVLLDLHMPGLDGWELARRIRADVDLKAIRLLAVSVGPAGEAEALEAGCDGYFPMPFEPGDLFAAVAGLLTRDAVR